ncbi:MAG: hypothetical protein U1E22_03660, partial [Coriobacteriia bacterium]|nr:hypothetical protein [Coriobacteriia bacterium]
MEEDTAVRIASHYGRASEVVGFQSISEPPPAPAKPVSRRSAEKTGDSMLARYFREMATHQVMGPDDEVRAAESVEAVEIAYWRSILS